MSGVKAPVNGEKDNEKSRGANEGVAQDVVDVGQIKLPARHKLHQKDYQKIILTKNAANQT